MSNKLTKEVNGYSGLSAVSMVGRTGEGGWKGREIDIEKQNNRWSYLNVLAWGYSYLAKLGRL